MKKKVKKSWYKTWWGILIMIFLFINIFPYLSTKLAQVQKQKEGIVLETTENNTANQVNDIAHTSQTNNSPIKSNITIDGFSSFSSDTFGFSVLMPEQPKENIVDLSDLTIHNFQAERVINETNPMIYSINIGINNNGKILSDDAISAFLDNYLSGRLSIATNAKIIEEKDTIFKGFPAKEYKYLSKIDSIELEHRGIIFVIDGDHMTLSIAYPSSLKEGLVKYDEFKKSFNLMAVDVLLKENSLLNGKIKFDSPQNWKKLNSQAVDRIAAYASMAGHSIELHEQKSTCKEMADQIGTSNIDNNGYMHHIFPIDKYNINMKIIVKCIEDGQQAYTLSGIAPEKYFFRSELIFNKALDSFDFK